MATPTAAEKQAEQILTTLMPHLLPAIDKGVETGLEKRFGKTPVQEAIGKVAPYAAQMGMSPSQWMAKMVSPELSWSISPNGMPTPIAKQLWNQGKSVGYCERYDRETGTRIGGEFSMFLKSMYDMNPNSLLHGKCTAKDAENARARCKEWGVCTATRNPDGTITKTALAESSGVTGGYTVPPFFYDQLMTFAVENSLIEKDATKIPLTGRSIQVPSLNISGAVGAGNSNLLAGIVATWVSEAQLRPETEPQFLQTELTAWELSFISIASNTLLQDNAVSLDALLTNLFKLAIGWYKDYAFFQGNGVGKPLGILNAPSTIQVVREAASKFTWYDATAMLSTVYSMLLGGKLAWFMHQSVLPQLLRMNDDSGGSQTGRVVFVPINQGAVGGLDHPDGVQSVGKLFNHNVYLTEKLPALGTTGCVLLAHVPSYLIGEKLDLEIDVSPHYKFANNQMTWRVVARCDGQPWLQGPITLADGVKQVSCFITLTQ
jgi:HK97 family phage major capsid protein